MERNRKRALGILLLTGALLGMAGGASACDDHCGHLTGRGATFPSFPPYGMELEMVDCAGLMGDFTRTGVIEPLELDLMIQHARRLPLHEWLQRSTYQATPRKYSSLAPLRKLVRLKQLVEAFYAEPAPEPQAENNREPHATTNNEPQAANDSEPQPPKLD